MWKHVIINGFCGRQLEINSQQGVLLELLAGFTEGPSVPHPWLRSRMPWEQQGLQIPQGKASSGLGHQGAGCLRPFRVWVGSGVAVVLIAPTDLRATLCKSSERTSSGVATKIRSHV